MERPLGLDAEVAEWLCLVLLFISLSLRILWGALTHNEERRRL